MTKKETKGEVLFTCRGRLTLRCIKEYLLSITSDTCLSHYFKAKLEEQQQQKNKLYTEKIHHTILLCTEHGEVLHNKSQMSQLPGELQ